MCNNLSIDIMSKHIEWSNLSDPKIVEQLGKYIKIMRLNANISQEEVAEKAGISRSSVYNIENGKGVVNMRTLIVYLRILGMLNLLDGFITEENIDAKWMTRKYFEYKPKKRVTKK